MKIFLIIPLVMLVLVMGAPFSQAQSVPDWVKNTAGWWATDAISENEFVNAITFLVNVGIIQIEKDCKFLDNEFSHLSEKDKWFLCNTDFEYLDDWIEPEISNSEIKLNSKGFRGEDFVEQKNENTVRIFAVGGSTTFGNGVSDENTYPVILEKMLNSIVLEKEIEIVNAGFGGAWSKTESDLIKDRMLNYQPDIFIIYDGWNDVQNEVFNMNNNEIMWKDRWTDICELAEEKNFHVIILLQPTIGTISVDKRIPVDQEIIIWNMRNFENVPLTKAYEKYPNVIPILEEKCTVAKNFRGIFDETYVGIFYDYGHTNALGNKIIAKNVLNEIIPVLEEKFLIKTTINAEKNNMREFTSVLPDLDFRGKIIENESFDNMNLQNANFQYAILNNVNFSNVNFKNVDFRFSVILNSNFETSNLKESTFARSEIHSTKFSNSNLEESYIGVSTIKDSVFFNSNLKKSQLKGSTLINTEFENSKIIDSLFYQTVLINSNIFEENFTNTTLMHSTFILCDAFEKDLSTLNILQGNKFMDCDFDNTKLPTELHDSDFSAKTYNGIEYKGTSLQNVDFSNLDISNVVFSSTKILIDLTDDMDLSLYTTNLSNSIFAKTELIGKNLSLVDLTGADLKCIGHQICN